MLLSALQLSFQHQLHQAWLDLLLVLLIPLVMLDPVVGSTLEVEWKLNLRFPSQRLPRLVQTPPLH